MSADRALIWHVSVLLDYLGRQSNNRLQAQFADIRPQLSAHTGQIAVPPENSYLKFLQRLNDIKITHKAGTALSPQDQSFLQSARDFLAAVAAPATVESIQITRSYMEFRASEQQPQSSRRIFFRRRPAPQPAGRGQEERAELRGKYENSARWIAKSVARLERSVLAAALVAVVLSTYAMVGQSIIDDSRHALARLQDANNAIEHDVALIAKSTLTRVGWSSAQLDSNIATQTCAPGLQQNGRVVAELPAVYRNTVSDPTVSPIEDLTQQCRRWRWALMQLISENIRLKSWGTPFMHEYLRIRIDLRWLQLGKRELAIPNPFGWSLGWFDSELQRAQVVGNDVFCGVISKSYLQIEPHPHGPNGACGTLIDGVVRDSASTALSILALVTNSVLPCLYSFIGASLATLFVIGRKIDASLLAYTDRAAVTFGAIRGVVFGAIIGVFAGYVNKDATNVLGLSAIALLAGINVPGVFTFLTELSNRVFGSPSATAKV